MDEIDEILDNRPEPHDDFGRRKASKRCVAEVGIGYR